MENHLLIPFILFVFGAAALALYFHLSRKRRKLLDTGIPAEGIVYDFTSRMTNDSSGNYPVIRFLTKKNEWITRTYKISYPGFILKKGQKVEVYYNPENPSDFVLNLKADRWLLLLLVCLSLFFFGWGIVSILNESSIK